MTRRMRNKRSTLNLPDRSCLCLLILLCWERCCVDGWNRRPADCFVIASPSADFSNNTAAIQLAIDQHDCVSLEADHLSSGGDYRISSISLKSHFVLHLGSNIRLVAVIGSTREALVSVENATNVTIQGHGMLYGSAEDVISHYNAYDNRFEPIYKDGSPWRPHNLWIVNSESLWVQGISLHNASDWSFRMDNSSHIVVDSVDIYGDSRFPNNDGFDPQSCRNVTLINSNIDVADDGICPKARLGMGPLDGLVVRNCTIRSKSHAIKFGSNTDTDMKNVLFDNITIWDSNAGLSIQQRSAGNLHNITFSNIQIETRYHAGRWWGNGEWLSVTRVPRHENDKVGEINNLRFINITARSENGGLLSGFPHYGIHSVLFRNIYVKISAWSNYSTNPQQCCALERPPFCSDGGLTRRAGRLLTRWVPKGLTEANYTRMSCLGSRDYRPLENAAPLDCPRGHDRIPGRADGIYAEHVRALHLDNVTIKFSAPRKVWFGECVHLCNQNGDLADEKMVVRGLESVRCLHGPSDEFSERG